MFTCPVPLTVGDASTNYQTYRKFQRNFLRVSWQARKDMKLGVWRGLLQTRAVLPRNLLQSLSLLQLMIPTLIQESSISHSEAVRLLKSVHRAHRLGHLILITELWKLQNSITCKALKSLKVRLALMHLLNGLVDFTTARRRSLSINFQRSVTRKTPTSGRKTLRGISTRKPTLKFFTKINLSANESHKEAASILTGWLSVAISLSLRKICQSKPSHRSVLSRSAILLIQATTRLSEAARRALSIATSKSRKKTLFSIRKVSKVPFGTQPHRCSSQFQRHPLWETNVTDQTLR